MKRIFSSVIIVVFLLVFTGCGNTNNSNPNDNQSNDTLTNNAQTSSNDTTSNNDIINEKKDRLVDLTKLSSTMVYAEVLNMLMHSDDYIGNTIKMNGQFTVYTHPETGKKFFTVIIADSTGCCAQGIEFTLLGDKSYPEDYPEEGSNVTVIGHVGENSFYEEDGYTFCTLNDAEFVVD